jgi:Ni2+-binding GTPase involved in maturation of urease and hydrogenase
VVVLDEVVEWAGKVRSDYLFVETAGLCLRCSPYVENSLGVVVLEATSGMNLPRKIGPMLTLADISVITKIDLISQAEREVFRYRVLEAAKDIHVVETNALYGIGIDPIVKQILKTSDVEFPMYLRGNPPVGTCTICVGKKEIGAKNHFGVLRTMEQELFYVGE